MSLELSGVVLLDDCQTSWTSRERLLVNVTAMLASDKVIRPIDAMPPYFQLGSSVGIILWVLQFQFNLWISSFAPVLAAEYKKCILSLASVLAAE